MKIFFSTVLMFLWTVLWYYIFENAYISLSIGIWLYMAINIGANDVANSVWPAVGSKAITIRQAIIIAAAWNFLWAIVAWWDVVKTIKKGIIDISGVSATFWTQWNEIFVIIMLSALLAWAIWLTFATYFRAPISTTHSIVGWVMWAWITALGFSAVSWSTMSKIAASWVISPILGWIIAAMFLYFIKKTIIFQEDKVTAAKKWVPVFVGIMAWAFTTYIMVKWIKHLIIIDFSIAVIYWTLVAIITYFLVKNKLKKKNNILNTRESIANLFTIPLIFAVALLTFAHWANDVANAIGPVAAIFDTVMNNSISTKVDLPIWILLMWGLGISFWLSMFWPRIIKVVWTEITKVDKIRAFTVALAASITVIIASQLGLPVSSTHIAIGWIIWVWVLRELLDRKDWKVQEKHVKRGLVKKIVAAWLITVPAAALLSSLLFVILKYILL